MDISLPCNSTPGPKVGRSSGPYESGVVVDNELLENLLFADTDLVLSFNLSSVLCFLGRFEMHSGFSLLFSLNEFECFLLSLLG